MRCICINSVGLKPEQGNTFISNHNLPLITACTEYAVYILNIYIYTAARFYSKCILTLEYITIVTQRIYRGWYAIYTKFIQILSTTNLLLGGKCLCLAYAKYILSIYRYLAQPTFYRIVQSVFYKIISIYKYLVQRIFL